MVTYNQQMAAEGMVSGSKQQSGKRSLRVPLFVLFLFGLATSVALPYGIGLAVFVWAIALIGALAGVAFASYVLLKELLGKTASFGYAPTMAYLAGKKTNKGRKEKSSQ